MSSPLQPLQPTSEKREFRLARDRRDGSIVALLHEKEFNPIHHEWVDEAENVSVAHKKPSKAEKPQAVGSVDSGELEVLPVKEARLQELKDKRVWLHGTEEEKAEFELLKNA